MVSKKNGHFPELKKSWYIPELPILPGKRQYSLASCSRQIPSLLLSLSTAGTETA